MARWVDDLTLDPRLRCRWRRARRSRYRQPERLECIDAAAANAPVTGLAAARTSIDTPFPCASPGLPRRLYTLPGMASRNGGAIPARAEAPLGLASRGEPPRHRKPRCAISILARIAPAVEARQPVLGDRDRAYSSSDVSAIVEEWGCRRRRTGPKSAFRYERMKASRASLRVAGLTSGCSQRTTTARTQGAQTPGGYAQCTQCALVMAAGTLRITCDAEVSITARGRGRRFE